MCSNENDAKPKGSGRRSTKGKQRPAYKRRVKPPYSYVELIGMAIKSSPSQMKTLREILDYMQTRFPCFRGTYVGWKNSVRHNLSAAECFVKILRNEQRPFGKDNYWTMNLDCTHCYNNSIGRVGQQKRRSGTSGAIREPMRPPPTPSYSYCESPHQRTPVSPSVSEFDAGFHEGNSVHEWVVANQALSPRIADHAPTPNSAPVQYIELRYTNPSPSAQNQHRDISRFDFASSVTRVPIDSMKSNFTHCSTPSSHSNNTRAQSSSSAAESVATHSSGFESSCEAFDLETVGEDHLNMIMDDDLFVPDDDLDLSLYEDWPTPNMKMENTAERSELCEELYTAASPLSQSDASHPPSPLSVTNGSICSEIRTSNTPPQPQYFKHEFHHPQSPNEHCYYGSSSTQQLQPEFYHEYANLPSTHRSQSSQFQSQYQHSFNSQTTSSSTVRSDNNWISSDVWMQCSNGSSSNSSPRASPAPTSPSPATVPSLHSPHIIPTFESMLTSAVRESLSLDSVEASSH